jgi:hypothetical protein
LDRIQQKRIKMKKQLSYILGVMLVSFAGYGQSVDSLFSKYIKATGGMELYKSIENYSVHQLGTESNVPYESKLAVAFNEKKVLKTRTVLSRNFLYNLDGTDATLYIPTGGLNRASTYQSQKLSDFEKSKLDIEFSDKFMPLLDYKAKGYKARLVGTKNINKVDLIQVELTKGDITRNYYFNPKTDLIAQEDITYSNGEKVIYQHNTYSKLENGLSYPSESIMTESGKTRKISSELIVNAVPESDYNVN